MRLPNGDHPPLIYHSTQIDHVWLRRRLIYYAGLWAMPVLIGLRLGPNLLLFHSLVRPGPAAYVPYTRQFTTVIAAIKAYQRDHGELPPDVYTLEKKYLPADYDGPEGEILDTTSVTFAITPHRGIVVLEYEFSPQKEGWYLHAPGYDGKLDVPIVPAAPATRPTTAPVNGGLP